MFEEKVRNTAQISSLCFSLFLVLARQRAPSQRLAQSCDYRSIENERGASPCRDAIVYLFRDECGGCALSVIEDGLIGGEME